MLRASILLPLFVRWPFVRRRLGVRGRLARDLLRGGAARSLGTSRCRVSRFLTLAWMRFGSLAFGSPFGAWIFHVVHLGMRASRVSELGARALRPCHFRSHTLCMHGFRVAFHPGHFRPRAFTLGCLRPRFPKCPANRGRTGPQSRCARWAGEGLSLSQPALVSGRTRYVLWCNMERCQGRSSMKVAAGIRRPVEARRPPDG